MADSDVVSREVTPFEAAALRKHFDALRAGTDTVHVNAVGDIFKLLGVNASAELITAMVTEHASLDQCQVTFEDVTSVFAEWKILTRMQLRDFKSEQDANPAQTRTKGFRMWFLPDAPWRAAWSFAVMLVSLAHWTIVLARDADEGWYRPVYTPYVVIDFIFSAVYAGDLALWVLARRYALESAGIHARAAPSYLRSVWFIVDALSAMPLDVILSLGGASTASAVLSHLRLLRYPRVMAFWVRTHEFALSPGRIVFFLQVLPLWLLFYALFGLITVNALFFKLIRDASGTNTDVMYIQAVYFVIQTFTTVGYGDIPMNSIAEMWFAIFLVFFGLLINAVAIGRLVTQIQRSNAYVTREDKLRETLAVLQYFHLPLDLQTEILSFQEHVLWNDTANAYYSRTSNLPQSIRDTMLLQTRVDVLRHVPVFKEAPPAALNAFASALLGICYKPEEYISFSGDPHAGVRFVLFGFIARFDSKGHYDTTVKSGDYFGFEGILALSDELYSHKALSYCDVWVLPPSQLRAILGRYPRFLLQFQKEMAALHPEQASDIANTTLTTEQLRELSEGEERGSDLRSLRSQLRTLKRRLESVVATQRDTRIGSQVF